MNKFNGKILTAVAVIACAGSVFAFPGHCHPHPVPVHHHHHHHPCGNRGLFEGLAIANTAMAGVALVSDIVATQRAASQPQTTVVVQQPAPVVVQQTAPVVVQQPAPVVVQQPAPVVVQQPVATTVVRGGVAVF